MCGIVGAIAERNILPILLEGLRRLEYRGYDSAGVALRSDDGTIQRERTVGKVSVLAERLESRPLRGHLGIAHTRWATHGGPVERNAHPHLSAPVAVVHNGIIENHADLRDRLRAAGFEFESETDTEVIAHLIEYYRRQSGDLLESVRRSLRELHGAYALAIISADDPDRLIVAREGSPLVIGVGIGEHFVASDVFALLPVTQSFIFLEDGDLAEVARESVTVFDRNDRLVSRAEAQSELTSEAVDKEGYRHFMLKEIFEQPRAVAETLEGRVLDGRLLEGCFGLLAEEIFGRCQAVHIVACGTSYHAGLVARYWLEGMGVPCAVELASEYRYRPVVVLPGTLFVTVSQSGETADTLAALRKAREDRRYLATLAICNVPESSLVRESDITILTRAGREIGVASTKAFTTQLVVLQLLSVALGVHHDLSQEGAAERLRDLETAPRRLEEALQMNAAVERAAAHFAEKTHALFLGRGPEYPVAMEGALKLKEISYIHAEAYAAGELKHGPLALVDSEMPVICVLPKSPLLDKVLSNLEEVRARGGKLFLFADPETSHGFDDNTVVLPVVSAPVSIAPLVYTVPLQLLAYHVAVLKGTDVDQPRNLAKSVTVE